MSKVVVKSKVYLRWAAVFFIPPVFLLFPVTLTVIKGNLAILMEKPFLFFYTLPVSISVVFFVLFLRARSQQ